MLWLFVILLNDRQSAQGKNFPHVFYPIDESFLREHRAAQAPIDKCIRHWHQIFVAAAMD